MCLNTLGHVYALFLQLAYFSHKNEIGPIQYFWRTHNLRGHVCRSSGSSWKYSQSNCSSWYQPIKIFSIIEAMGWFYLKCHRSTLSIIVTGNMNIQNVSSWMNIHNICHGWYEYSLLHGMVIWIFMSTLRVTWIFMRHVTGDMNIHEHVTVTWIFMSTCDGWLHIHEHTWRMTEYPWSHVTSDWIFMTTRLRWHEYSWAHVTDDRYIHVSRHGWQEYYCVTSRVLGIFMSARHGWHGYPWVHVMGDMNIHE